ncbi:hypothetical protein R50072_28100 [Simiduia litorea]|uniref:PKD domain-containing protein n=1 Tax=Simiduia litorea TaxID=1435348 RepID=UPI0036F3D5DD
MRRLRSVCSALVIAVSITLLVACGGGGSGSGSGSKAPVSPPPSISGLSTAQAVVGQAVQVDVNSESSAGNPTVSVRIVSVPSGSSLSGVELSGSSVEVTFDVTGFYQLEAKVTDSAGSVSKRFDLEVINNNPVAQVAGPDRANLLSPLYLNASLSYDPDLHGLTYEWRLVEKPAGSNMPQALGQAATLELLPDVKGLYLVSLTAIDAYGASNTTEFAFTTSAFKFRRFIFNVVDAVYSDAHDAVVAVGDDQKFYVYSMETHATRALTLAHPGTSVSVLPDGSKAAVGHDGFISIIDLSAMAVESVMPVSTDVFDIEIATNGFVYAMPKTDQWESLRSLKMDTGEEFQSGGYSVRAGTVMKMHPTQQSIYGANRGLSPSDIEKYDISAGAPSYLYDSPYHGNYAMCGDLWISRDGLRIFTRCGNVFRSSDVREQDMLYNGSLDLVQNIASLSHFGEKVAYIDSGETDKIAYYGYSVLTPKGKAELPVEITNGESYRVDGRFVFHRPDGQEIVLAQVDASAGYLRDWGVAYLPSEVETFNLPPVAIADANSYANINEELLVSAEQSLDPEGASLSYQWELQSRPSDSISELVNADASVVSFVPDIKGEYTLRVKVNDGEMDSAYTTVKVTAEDPADKRLLALDFEVLASTFSVSRNQLVLSASSPARLVLVDVETLERREIALGASAAVLSLNPAGNKAAVAYGNTVAIVDLVGASVISTFSVSAPVIDLVLPDNGYVYVFPASDQWTRITTIALDTGVQQQHQGNYIRAGTRVDLHPSGKFIYGADNGLSPSDIELYDIQAGNAVYVKDSPYHGDFAMCGDVWVAENGESLFTRCGNVFKANPGQADDMIYRGALNLNGAAIGSLSQSGDELAILLEPRYSHTGEQELGHTINLFSHASNSFVRSIDIPATLVGDVAYHNYGQNIFHTADGTLVAIVKVNSAAGKIFEYSLFIYSR